MRIPPATFQYFSPAGSSVTPFAIEQCWRFWIHSFCDCRLGLFRKAVANCTVLAVDVRPSGIVGFISRDRYESRHFPLSPDAESFLANSFSKGISGAAVATGAIP